MVVLSLCLLAYLLGNPDLSSRNATNSNFWFANSGLKKIFYISTLWSTILNVDKGTCKIMSEVRARGKYGKKKGSFPLFIRLSFSFRVYEGAKRVKTAFYKLSCHIHSLIHWSCHLKIFLKNKNKKVKQCWPPNRTSWLSHQITKLLHFWKNSSIWEFEFF